ncbi:hypothetical protein HX088_02155 [Empedobacter sp. 225-1]|uniref:hypothetical protein n=1 Tax=unclassified Empedobacter TaxID=2643773 RepID=UPI0025789DFC|nr:MULTISPECIES: hypothetical protein [unclassified Empedobacter]MDM1522082.1 hypothetical protein [Empedobacter sp. 225-1]MDM1542144.1 hypothetical protein [Empedobacter sp. 189-2]
MKKSFTIIAIIFISISTYAQVGINTEDPKTTLHVKEFDELNLTVPEGVMTPKFTGNELILKGNLYTEEQTGTIVYVSEIATEALTDKTVNVNSIGYYFFDGLVWQKMNKEPWKVQGTANQASNNYENIYQKGNVAIGTDENENPLDVNLYVKGDLLIHDHEGSGENQYGSASYFGSKTFNESGDLAFADMYTRYKGEKLNINSINDLYSVLSKDFFTYGFNVFQESNNLRASLEYSAHNDTTDPTNPLSQVQENGISGNTAFAETKAIAGNVTNLFTMKSTLDSNIYTRNSFRLTSFMNNVGNGLILSDVDRGITFQYNKRNGNDIEHGNYSFPQSMGLKNQVLVTSGFSDLDVVPQANLSWKNIDDIIHNQVYLKSNNGSCFKITVSDTGDLSTQAITCTE